MPGFDKETIIKRLIMIELNSIKNTIKAVILNDSFTNEEKYSKVITHLNTLQPKIYQRLQGLENFLKKDIDIP